MAVHVQQEGHLIVEDDAYIAMDLAAAVEDYDGIVIGPFASVAEALTVIGLQPIAGAVLDANLVDRDVTPLALKLHQVAVPFIVHTGTGVPRELAAAIPDVPVIMKPASSKTIVERLLQRFDAP